MTEFKAHFKSVQPDLGGSLPGNLIFGVPGKDGGYYAIQITQPDSDTMRLMFTASKEGMEQIVPADILLPKGPKGEPGEVDMDQILRFIAEYLSQNPPQVTEKDPTVPDWAKEETKPSYSKSEVGLGNVDNVKQYSTSNPPPYPVVSVNGKTGKVQLGAADVGALPDTYVPPDQTAAQVGADPAGTAAAAVSSHNTSTDSHGDLRLELKAINDRLTAFFDSDNQTLDELSEIVAYITSNKALIDSITTSKVSVTDIINNLTTNVANKPLSAAQGVALKGLIDAVSNSLSNYQPKGDYALRSELPTVPTNVSAFTNDAGYLTEHQDISGKVDKVGLTLGRHADGLLYVFVDGQPVGNGVDLPAGGIDGYITPDKQIVFNNLPDGEYTLAYINDDGSIVPIGAMEKDTNVYYTITNKLTNCTNSNGTTQAVQGGSYSATISANDGYELSSVMVTMGGTDISSTAVSGGKITIANVTGNIVIVAVAEEVKAAEIVNQIPLSIDTDGTVYNGIGYKTGVRIKGDGSVTSGTGISTTGFIPVSVGDTVYMKGLTFEDTSYTRLVHYDSNKSYVTVEPKMTFPTTDWTNEGNGVYSYTIANESAAYIRVASYHIMDGSEIITINQPIM